MRDVHQIAQPTAKEQVSAELLEFPVKTIMRITGASADAVKAWRVERRFPSWEYLKRLEPHLDSVRAYMAQEFPHSFAAAHPESPEALDVLAKRLLTHMQQRERGE